MELTSFELHLFVSLAVILGAALVALIVDYLKGNNEQLREHNIELRVRREELEKRGPAEPWAWLGRRMQPTRLQQRTASWMSGAMQSPAERTQPRSVPAAEAQTAAVHAEAASGSARRRAHGADELRAARPDQAMTPAVEAVARVAETRVAKERVPVEAREEVCLTQQGNAGGSPVVKQEIVVVEKPAAQVPSLLLDQVIAVTPSRLQNTSGSPVAVSAPAAAREAAVQAGAAGDRLASPAFVPASPEDQWTTSPATPEPLAAVPVVRIEEPVGTPEPAPQTEAEAPAPAVIVPEPLREKPVLAPPVDPFTYRPLLMAQPVAADPLPVEPVVAETPALTPLAEPRVVAAPVPQAGPAPAVETGTAPARSLPSGFHERSAALRYIEQGTPVSGLVVAVAIQDLAQIKENAGRASLEDFMRSINNLMRSLAGEEDFGARTGEDEFVFVYSLPEGTGPQRVTNRLSERLWDFQLRSLGNLSVMFQWGAAEARQLPLGEAITSARDRMHQSRRARKTVSVEAARRRASA